MVSSVSSVVVLSGYQNAFDDRHLIRSFRRLCFIEFHLLRASPYDDEVSHAAASLFVSTSRFHTRIRFHPLHGLQNGVLAKTRRIRCFIVSPALTLFVSIVKLHIPSPLKSICTFFPSPLDFYPGSLTSF